MPLTVVQVVPALHAGGVEGVTLETARGLVEAGHRSIVISAGGRLVKPLIEGGSEHVSMSIGAKSPLTLRMIPRLRRLLVSREADILHASSRMPAWVAYLAWRGMSSARRPRFVTAVHGAHSVNRYSEIMTAGERVIAVSEYIRSYILDGFPHVPPERIRVIPNGIDPTRFPHGYVPDDRWRDRWRAELPELVGRTIVTLPGRLSRRKGHEDFIEVLRIVRERRADVHGLVVGGAPPRRGGYVEELKRLAEGAGIAPHLTFTGHREDVREILASSSAVMVLPARPEAFGRVALEALSLGVPVVGYDFGGTAEILREMYPDGRVPAGNPAAAANRLLRLLDSPAPVPKSDAFPLSSTIADLLACYEELAMAAPGKDRTG